MSPPRLEIKAFWHGAVVFFTLYASLLSHSEALLLQHPTRQLRTLPGRL